MAIEVSLEHNTETTKEDRDADKWRLQRFLILGTESGAYKADKKEFARKDVQCIHRLISQGRGPEIVETICQTNKLRGKGHRQPVLYALATCTRSEDPDTKEAAYGALQEVCPQPKDLLKFVKYCEAVSQGTGWGRAQRRAISNWYNSFKDRPKILAKGVTKIPNNTEWTHRDVCRLAHVKPESAFIMLIIRYITKGLIAAKNLPSPVQSNDVQQWKDIIRYFEAVEETKSFTGSMKVEDKLDIIRNHRLNPCQLSTALNRSLDVWKVLLNHIPLGLVLKNILKVEKVPIDTPCLDRLKNVDELQNVNVNPFEVMVAMKEAKKEDTKNSLEKAFEICVQNVTSTNKKYSVVIWVGEEIDSDLEGKKTVTARDVIAAFAYTIAKRAHPDSEIVTYSGEEKQKLLIPNTGVLKYISEEETLSDMNSDYKQLVHHVEKSKKSDVPFDAVVIVMYAQDEDFKRRLSTVFSDTGDFRVVIISLVPSDVPMKDHRNPYMLDVLGFGANTTEAIMRFVEGK